MNTPISWALKEVEIKLLKENPKNPRQITHEMTERLSGLISKFGLIDKPIINADYIIIGGHQRIKALKKQKVKNVQCWFPDRLLSQQEIDELSIGLNLYQGQWDVKILSEEWNPVDLLEYGFTVDQLMGASKENDATLNDLIGEEKEVLAPCKDEDAKTKPCDIFTLGNHRLMCGNSTNPENVAALLNGEKPILMVTDPPYGVNYDASWRGKAGKGQRATGKVQNDDKIDWNMAWNLFTGAVAYVWHAGKYCSEVQDSLASSDFEVISQIVWVKQHFALSRGDYHWQHEPCWYAVKKGHQHNWQGARDQSTTWEICNLNAFGKSKDEERTSHSTQKPLECMARPIKNNTAEGEGVYDPFCGSGTTLIAAEMLNRKSYCMEISPAYCDVIIKRYIDFMDKKGVECVITKNGIPISKKELLE